MLDVRLVLIAGGQRLVSVVALFDNFIHTISKSDSDSRRPSSKVTASDNSCNVQKDSTPAPASAASKHWTNSSFPVSGSHSDCQTFVSGADEPPDFCDEEEGWRSESKERNASSFRNEEDRYHVGVVDLAEVDEYSSAEVACGEMACRRNLARDRRTTSLD